MRGALIAIVATACCACTAPETPPHGFDWGLAPGIEPPPVPAANPQTAQKVELGRHLFYDFRLARNEKRSCGICHEDKKGFTDGFVRAVGATNEVHPRNTLSLSNLGYRESLTWVHPELGSLEEQLLIPLLGTDPIELGFGGHEDELTERLAALPLYQDLFAAAYPGSPNPITLESVAMAIAAFERTMISRNAPYDRYLRGERDAISDDARRGAELFFSPRAGCSRCHGGDDFMAIADDSGEVMAAHGFFNVGLYNVDGAGAYPDGRTGRHSITGDPDDMGVVRVPTLRNVERSHPYFSDGSGASLEDVVAVFDRGGRLTDSGPNVGDGRDSPLKSPLIKPLGLSETERGQLVAFLCSLTEEEFLTDPRFSDPFPRDE